MNDQARTPPHELLSVEAAAQRLSIGRTTMYGLIKAGDVRAVRVGRLRRVPAGALAAYVQQLVTDQASA
jgi:excisionase family DNA binding protein